MSTRMRILVATLALSTAGYAAWKESEGFSDKAIIPTRGDVPTLGHGSTHYEDGTRVKMSDTITRPRADELARNLIRTDEKRFADSLHPDTRLYQVEYDVYLDFVGQYGIGNWRASSMRREVLAGDYAQACKSLLKYRFSAGYDCSTPGNRICSGVWTRQLKRHAKCMAAQS